MYAAGINVNEFLCTADINGNEFLCTTDTDDNASRVMIMNQEY